jgi:hypothetical protein
MSNHVTTNHVMSSHVLNATPVLPIVLHANLVNHNMSVKKTPMRDHKLVVNSVQSAKSCTSIPS